MTAKIVIISVNLHPGNDCGNHGADSGQVVHKVSVAVGIKCRVLSSGFRKARWTIGYSL